MEELSARRRAEDWLAPERRYIWYNIFMPPFLNSAALILLGFLPSLIWLVFYYREDCHPEPKHLITRAFLMGIIVSPLAIIFQYAFLKLTPGFYSDFVAIKGPGFFFWSALVEEVIKFYAIRLTI